MYSESEVWLMSMSKAIASGKEHRREYRGSKAIDKTCRNHGSCEWCKANRLYKNTKKVLDKDLKMWYN